MSLETVLKIGKIYRNSTQYGLDEHRFVIKTSSDMENVRKNKDESKNPIETIIYKIPVKVTEQNRVDICLIEKEILKNEDEIKKLRNLNFKTSDKDKDKKYLFGDIVYSIIKDKPAGNYRMANMKEKSSFFRGELEVQKIQLPIIIAFHKALKNQIQEVESLLQSAPSIVIHFNFEGKHWFEFEGVMDAVNKKLIEGFITESTLPNERKVVALAKSLFKTIKPPLFDNKTKLFKDPDGVGASTPGFKNTDSYKVKTFQSVDDVINLFYGIKTAEKKMFVRIKNDIGIIALPILDIEIYEDIDYNLLAKTLNNFFPQKGESNGEDYDETEQKLNLDLNEDYDDIFQGLIQNQLPEEIGFDIVFIKPPGMSTPSVDLVEISNLKKSFLRTVHENIRAKKQILLEQFNSEPNSAKFKIKPAFRIRESFQRLLDDRTKNQKRYQSHMLKVLPQIYSDTYYFDPILLPLFISQTEYSIRNEGLPFVVLKYDFKFLMSIQKFDNMTSVINSKSYKLGLCLGIMSKPLAAWRDDCPIKSFEKSYVGNLSRRILSTTEALKFSNFLNEKLIMHEKLYPDQKEAFLEFTKILKDFGAEKYDRNTAALGFFESYFTSDRKKEKGN